MVQLHHLDIVLFPEGAGQFGQDLEQHIDADAHIGRPEHAAAFGQLRQFLLLFIGEAGGADHMSGTELGHTAGRGQTDLGSGEIDDDSFAVQTLQQLFHILAHRARQRGQTGSKFAAFHHARKREGGVFLHQRADGPAHTAIGTHDDDRRAHCFTCPVLLKVMRPSCQRADSRKLLHQGR